MDISIYTKTENKTNRRTGPSDENERRCFVFQRRPTDSAWFFLIPEFSFPRLVCSLTDYYHLYAGLGWMVQCCCHVLSTRVGHSGVWIIIALFQHHISSCKIVWTVKNIFLPSIFVVNPWPDAGRGLGVGCAGGGHSFIRMLQLNWSQCPDRFTDRTRRPASCQW